MSSACMPGFPRTCHRAVHEARNNEAPGRRRTDVSRHFAHGPLPEYRACRQAHFVLHRTMEAPAIPFHCLWIAVFLAGLKSAGKRMVKWQSPGSRPISRPASGNRSRNLASDRWCSWHRRASLLIHDMTWGLMRELQPRLPLATPVHNAYAVLCHDQFCGPGGEGSHGGFLYLKPSISTVRP